jgi:hypothetical protein
VPPFAFVFSHFGFNVNNLSIFYCFTAEKVRSSINIDIALQNENALRNKVNFIAQSRHSGETVGNTRSEEE